MPSTSVWWLLKDVGSHWSKATDTALFRTASPGCLANQSSPSAQSPGENTEVSELLPGQAVLGVENQLWGPKQYWGASSVSHAVSGPVFPTVYGTS